MIQKTASRLEYNLIKAFLSKGKQVPIALASKITGRNYGAGFKTLNEFVRARENLFKREFVPAKKVYRSLLSREMPLEEAVSGMKYPVYRGETKLPFWAGYSSNTELLPRSIMSKLPRSYKPTLRDRLEGRRFFAGDPHNAVGYAVNPRGSGELVVVDLGTPLGQKALRDRVVVGTPHLDIPSSKWRKQVRRMIDSGEVVPQRDIHYPAQVTSTIPNPYAIDTEMTIPRRLRSSLNEKRFMISNARQIALRRAFGEHVPIRVMSKEDGMKARQLRDSIQHFISENSGKYDFIGFTPEKMVGLK